MNLSAKYVSDRMKKKGVALKSLKPCASFRENAENLKSAIAPLIRAIGLNRVGLFTRPIWATDGCPSGPDPEQHRVTLCRIGAYKLRS
jgi:hypothetical protein